MTPKAIIAKSLRDLRQKNRITQDELAERAGLKRGIITNAESEKSWPSSENLDALAKALEISPAYLLATPEERIKLEANPAPTLAEKLQAEVASLEPLQLEVLKKAIDALKATQPSGASKKKAQ